jgi:hypothetical protein
MLFVKNSVKNCEKILFSPQFFTRRSRLRPGDRGDLAIPLAPEHQPLGGKFCCQNSFFV